MLRCCIQNPSPLVRFILFWNGADSIRQKAWIRAHPGGYLRIVAHSLFGTWLLLNHTIPGMAAPAWWHLQSAALSVWLTRHWTAEQLLAYLVRSDRGLSSNHGSQPTVGAPSIRASCQIRTFRAACG